LFKEDPLLDDGSLFRATAQGLQVISGCAHSGIINTVRHARELTCQEQLHTWIGGTHLGPASPEQQQASLEALEAMRPSLVAANHCTGFAMMASLRQLFGERFVPAFVGTVLEL